MGPVYDTQSLPFLSYFFGPKKDCRHPTRVGRRPDWEDEAEDCRFPV